MLLYIAGALVSAGLGYGFKSVIHNEIVKAQSEIGKIRAEVAVAYSHLQDVLAKAAPDFKNDLSKLEAILKKYV